MKRNKRLLPNPDRPLRRDPDKPLKRVALNPGRPLRPVSPKTAARDGERAAILAGLTGCELAWLGRCFGPVDGHEVVRRSKQPGAQWDGRLVIGLCRRHHSKDEMMLEAERLGIRVPGWVWDRDGMTAVDEAARVRASHGKTLPYWYQESLGRATLPGCEGPPDRTDKR